MEARRGHLMVWDLGSLMQVRFLVCTRQRKLGEALRQIMPAPRRWFNGTNHLKTHCIYPSTVQARVARLAPPELAAEILWGACCAPSFNTHNSRRLTEYSVKTGTKHGVLEHPQSEARVELTGGPFCEVRHLPRQSRTILHFQCLGCALYLVRFPSTPFTFRKREKRIAFLARRTAFPGPTIASEHFSAFPRPSIVVSRTYLARLSCPFFIRVSTHWVPPPSCRLQRRPSRPMSWPVCFPPEFSPSPARPFPRLVSSLTFFFSHWRWDRPPSSIQPHLRRRPLSLLHYPRPRIVSSIASTSFLALHDSLPPSLLTAASRPRPCLPFLRRRDARPDAPPVASRKEIRWNASPSSRPFALHFPPPSGASFRLQLCLIR